MKTKISSKILVGLSLVFVLASAITQVYGDNSAGSAIPGQLPVVNIYSTADSVIRGETGAFVLSMKQSQPYKSYYPYVNFTVGGSAVPGIDYVQLLSPAFVGPSGYGTILVKTLLDPRGSVFRRDYDVEVKLQPGLGYTLGSNTSAKLTIKPTPLPIPLSSH
jgi:hypothetical protein